MGDKDCAMCKWYVGTWGGECRRFPPYHSMRLGTNKYPHVDDFTDVCGEFQPKEEKEEMSVWHDFTELADESNPNQYILAETRNGAWIKMSVWDLNAFLKSNSKAMIQKWAYIKELEKL